MQSFFFPVGDSLHNRQPAVAGTFYPASPDELKANLKNYFRAGQQRMTDKLVRALIVPHAGYVFSATVAAAAYNQLDTLYPYERIFIIGSSHRASYEGASVYCEGNFITPLGMVEVDRELGRKLIHDNPGVFTDNSEPQKEEHSLEVQLPFLQEKLGKHLKIVPVLIGSHTVASCQKIAHGLKPWFVPGNLFVISSDFSHYPNYEDAKNVDAETSDAICTNNVRSFLEILARHEKENIPELATSICGWTSALTLLDLTAGDNNLEYRKIMYQNSGDSPYGERSRVVGYEAIAVFEKTREATVQKQSTTDFNILPSEQRQLISIARTTLVNFVDKGQIPVFREDLLTGSLQSLCGAFVTLRINGELRGCIGQFTSVEPLWSLVRDMTIAAASRDYRFNPVTKEEVSHIEIEISVLTPLKRIDKPEEIILGKHGIYMKSGNSSGTFLPQVATETGWNLEEFLGHCARDKARIGWDGWKTADLYTYEAFIIEEKE